MREKSRKQGSNLSQSDLNEFTPVLIAKVMYLEDIDAIKSHRWYKSVYDAVSQFTREIKENLKSSRLDEVEYVHIPLNYYKN